MTKDKQIKNWVAGWLKTGDKLSAIKRKELREESYYEKNRDILNGMLQYACDHKTIRKSSGLVEQQRIFKILSSKRNNSSQ